MKNYPLYLVFLCALTGSFIGAYFLVNTLNILYLLALSLIILIILPIVTTRIMSMSIVITAIFLLNTKLERENFLKEQDTFCHRKAPFHARIISESNKIDGKSSLLIEINKKKVLLHLAQASSALPFKAGQEILFKKELQPFYKATSPADFDGQRYSLVHGIMCSAFIRDAALITVVGEHEPSLFSRISLEIKKRIKDSLVPHQASLLLALIFGDTTLFSSEQKDFYARIGAQHLLAVSGLQVSLLFFLCFFLFLPVFALILPSQHCHRAHALSASLSFILIWFFVFLANAPMSAVRAALMTSFLIIPLFIAKSIKVHDAYFASGIFILMIFPLAILDIGFLLSYAAVFGLITAHSQSKALLKSLKFRFLLMHHVFWLALASLAAFLATLPFLAVFFGSISPLSALANSVLLPFATLLQAPAIISGLVGAATKSVFLIKIAAYCALIIEILAEILSKELGFLVYFPLWPSWLLFFPLCGLFLLFLWILQARLSLAIFSSILIIIPIAYFLLSHENGLVMYSLPVGQGDATLIRMPSGHSILVDAGGPSFDSPDIDPAKTVILPLFKRLGIHKLDILLITHPDPDHIGGSFSLLNEIKVGEIWQSGFRPGHPLTHRLEKLALEKKIPIKRTRALFGSHSFGETKLELIAPITNNHSDYYEEEKANNNSIVIRISYKNIHILLPGDIELESEKRLIASKSQLKADLLKAPHHGSKTSSSEEFIAAVKPEAVIFSTGRNNRFSFPHKEVEERMKARGIKRYNTAYDGLITVHINDNGMKIKAFSDAL
jgi:competence protein ComEC